MKYLFSMYDEVKKLLTKHPTLRDNDERLMANIWWNHIPNIENMNGKEILALIAERKLPSFLSVSRCRRKIQETKPNLRGEKWISRHKRAERIRKEISI